MKRYIILFLLAMLLMPAMTEAHTLSVRLTINNTANEVYVPSIGETNSADITPAVYTDLPHFFAASYLNNLLAAVVPFSSKPVSISIDKAGNKHTIGSEQGLENSNTFLVFSKGDWKNIDSRIDLIESRKFLSEISPSFSFGLGLYYTIKIILEYTNIDIANDALFQKGTNNIVVENKGTSGGKPLVSVKRE